MEYRHNPVMLKEAIEHLAPKPGENFIDCTLGGAGYTIAIAKLAQPGKVLAVDLDPLAIKNAEKLIAKNNLKNIILANGNFRNLSNIIKENFKETDVKFNGIVFDLGLSSAQLEDRARGFSFQVDAPINMAFGPEGGVATEEIINYWPQEKLAGILREFGEENFSGRIARSIVEARKEEKIKTTGRLVEIIRSSLPGFYLRKKGIHFATKTFQALRIATNEELESLREALSQALEILDHGGRMVVISYHSLEDRMVKQFFKREGLDCICPPEFPVCRCDHRARLELITRKALKPSLEEIAKNPRSRSAKLRAAKLK